MSTAPMQFVRVVNEGERPFVGKFDLKPWRFAAGQAHFVPWEAACTWLGDPALQDSEALQTRSLMIQRLRTLYGVYHREVTDLHEQFNLNDANGTVGFPNLRVYGPNGDWIPMLLDVEYGGARPVQPDTPM